jgi:CheY-like chemotaxis protein
MRILFADDNPDTLKLYRLVLELQGFTVEVVDNGASAVEVVRHTSPFDAIVLDMEMPRMNGLDALKAIREMPQGQKPAIIIFTAYEAKALQAHVEEAGADDILFKPLLPQELVEALQRAVAQRTAATEP